MLRDSTKVMQEVCVRARNWHNGPIHHHTSNPLILAYTEAVCSPNYEFYAESLLKHLQKTRHFIFLLSNSLISIWPL